jgi:hypothetical protein
MFLATSLLALEIYWIWTRLIEPDVSSDDPMRPTSADIECAALVWQISLLLTEFREAGGEMSQVRKLDQVEQRAEDQSHQRSNRQRSVLQRFKRNLKLVGNVFTGHFASGWNRVEFMAFACTLTSLVWRQCIFQAQDSAGRTVEFDRPGVNEIMAVGILLSWMRVLRAMELSAQLGPLLAMVRTLASSRSFCCGSQLRWRRLLRCCSKTSSASWR